MRLRSVLLPQPEGPMMVMNSPWLGSSGMEKDTSLSAVKEPKRTVTFLTSTIGEDVGAGGDEVCQVRLRRYGNRTSARYFQTRSAIQAIKVMMTITR